jgi:hypothetical protein
VTSATPLTTATTQGGPRPGSQAQGRPPRLATVTTIAIDSQRSLGQLDRRIFGGFVEHLGRCIYGGLYEENTTLSDPRGFRSDVLTLLKDLRLSVLRWPGGNFVSNYHWQDGVGPKESRPVRPDLAWGGTESNRFGTDEFIEYCAELGAEPYICLNMGSTATLPGAPTGLTAAGPTATPALTASPGGGSATRSTGSGRSGHCPPRNTSPRRPAGPAQSR